MAWLLVAVCCCVVFLLVRSPWGRLLRGIREDEDAIRSLGKNVFAIKMQALIIGGLFGALGGMVYILPSSMQPDAMGRSLTFFCWTALLLGGAATVFGPVMGAVLFFARPHLHPGRVRRAGAQQHHEHRPDRAVRLDLRRRRADAAGDLPTTRNPRRQEGAAVQCLTRRRSTGTPGELADPEARRALMAGVSPEPGVGQAGPDPRGRPHHPQLRRHDRRHVEHLEVQRGIITALIGPNGAGKTTFFNLITGFDKPSSAKSGAHWSFEGRKLDKTSASSVALAGMVRTFQLTKSLNRMTVMDNMMLGARGQRGENLLTSMFKSTWGAQEKAIEEKAIELLHRF